MSSFSNFIEYDIFQILKLQLSVFLSSAAHQAVYYSIFLSYWLSLF